MTEEEAVKEFNRMVGRRMMTKNGISEKQHELFQLAMDSLEEIQQYRSIGTVEECREAMKRQRAKKYIDGNTRRCTGYYQCPTCGGLLTTNKRHCEDCGQRISWGEAR